MSVYIDPPRDYGGKFKHCSHMIADTPEELHAFALRIGCKRRWFQDKADSPHYDVFAGMRDKAVAFGAIEVTDKFMIDWQRRNRSRRLKGYTVHLKPAFTSWANDLNTGIVFPEKALTGIHVNQLESGIVIDVTIAELEENGSRAGIILTVPYDFLESIQAPASTPIV